MDTANAPTIMAGKHGHKYPGIDLPLRQVDDGDYQNHISSHPESLSHPSSLLQLREVAMMILMDRLTDKPNWNDKVFNQDIVSAWRQEALTQSEEQLYKSILNSEDISFSMPTRTRIISEKAFNNCIAELRDKAALFKDTGLIRTLDADDFTIVKSDTLVSPDLHHALRASFAKLMADQASNPDWHPWTNDMVQDLVHPSMYPFVYNRSRFIHDEVVGVADAIDKWSGKGQIPVQNLGQPDPPQDMWSYRRGIPKEYWSDKYQWLPANLAFEQDGSVKFTSYVNNLHPQRYSDIYRVIEKLIDTAIPAWDHVLDSDAIYKDVKDGLGRQKDRGPRFDLPPECEEENEQDVWEKFDPEIMKAAEQDGEVAYEDDEVEDHMEGLHWREIDDADEDTKKQWRDESIRQLKWKELRDPILPEPLDYEPASYSCGQSIREKFKDSGLQVIVKLASIELTPEKPEFPAGGWHIEGQLNEHIVATALYYIDGENIESSALSFRQPTSSDQDDLQERCGQDLYHYYEQVYGVLLGGGNDQCLQNYGSVETKPGRLLAFPNSFQHRVSSLSLKDKTKPGHRRFIALWLVNPEMRIISTANVPPQQFDWWWGSVVGDVEKGVKGQVPPEILSLVLDKTGTDNMASGEPRASRLSAESLGKLAEGQTSRLPPEILNMVRENETLDALMTVEEARQHRIALMEERSRFHEAGERNWSSYSFCEH